MQRTLEIARVYGYSILAFVPPIFAGKGLRWLVTVDHSPQSWIPMVFLIGTSGYGILKLVPETFDRPRKFYGHIATAIIIMIAFALDNTLAPR